MKASTIYRKAAKLVFKKSGAGDGFPSCCAVADYGPEELAFRYAKLFCPDDCPMMYWGDLWGDDIERKQCRVLALCLMAAISEDES